MRALQCRKLQPGTPGFLLQLELLNAARSGPGSGFPSQTSVTLQMKNGACDFRVSAQTWVGWLLEMEN